MGSDALIQNERGSSKIGRAPEGVAIIPRGAVGSGIDQAGKKNKAQGSAGVEAGFDPCANCPFRESGVCATLKGRGETEISGTHRSAKARQNLYHANDTLRGVPVICAGYAFRYVQLADGRRQILSFLQPGEVIWTGAFFLDRLHFSVQSVTDVRFCIYDRLDVARAVLSAADKLARIARQCAEESRAADFTILSLGRRKADERVAQFILDFTRRQEEMRGIAGGRYDFPLTQAHIADAVGLTQIHVSRVLKRLKRAEIVSQDGGFLTIADKEALALAAERGPGPTS